MHLLFWIYVGALAAGSASLAVAVLVYTQHRTQLSLFFALFLASLVLITLGMALERYVGLAAQPSSFRIRLAGLLVMVVGADSFMFSAPFFYHTIVGDEVRRGLRILYLAVAGLFLVLAVTVFFRPQFRPTLYALNLLLFGMIAFGLVFLALRYRRIGDRRLRRALRGFFIVAVVFALLMYADMQLRAMPDALMVLDGASLPLFFLAVHALAIRFTATYLNEPAYLTGGAISPHFRSRFGMSDREAEILRMLTAGHEIADIAEHVFVSPETVEGHIQAIFRKTAVRDRVELRNLMHEHRGVASGRSARSHTP